MDNTNKLKINYFTSFWVPIGGLITSNIIVIFFAISQKWNFPTIFMTYWFQSVIIGFFNTLRIFRLKEYKDVEIIGGKQAEYVDENRHKIITGLKFVFSYGLFHVFYAIILFGIFYKTLDMPFGWDQILLGSIIFFINQLFFYIKVRQEDKRERQNLASMLVSPFARIIPMHMVIVFYGSNIQGMGSLLLFMLIKTFLDTLSAMITRLGDIQNKSI